MAGTLKVRQGTKAVVVSYPESLVWGTYISTGSVGKADEAVLQALLRRMRQEGMETEVHAARAALDLKPLPTKVNTQQTARPAASAIAVGRAPAFA